MIKEIEKEIERLESASEPVLDMLRKTEALEEATKPDAEMERIWADAESDETGFPPDNPTPSEWELICMSREKYNYQEELFSIALLKELLASLGDGDQTIPHKGATPHGTDVTITLRDGLYAAKHMIDEDPKDYRVETVETNVVTLIAWLEEIYLSPEIIERLADKSAEAPAEAPDKQAEIFWTKKIQEIFGITLMPYKAYIKKWMDEGDAPETEIAPGIHAFTDDGCLIFDGAAGASIMHRRIYVPINKTNADEFIENFYEVIGKYNPEDIARDKAYEEVADGVGFYTYEEANDYLRTPEGEKEYEVFYKNYLKDLLKFKDDLTAICRRLEKTMR